MRGNSLTCVVAFAVLACGAEGREQAELLSGDLTGRLGGDTFPVRYGRLWDWDGDWGSRIRFSNGPSNVDCRGERTSDSPLPTFHAFMELGDPDSGQDWDGPHTIMRHSPRVELQFSTGQFHLDEVGEDWASGSLSWGGTGEEYGVEYTYTLDGTFTVERCYKEFPGD
jgi:hypothetical protein